MKIMTTIQPNNPFLIAGYYSPAYFCDRQQETATIISALHNERNLTLVAPRRMGKTEWFTAPKPATSFTIAFLPSGYGS